MLEELLVHLNLIGHYFEHLSNQFKSRNFKQHNDYSDCQKDLLDAPFITQLSFDCKPMAHFVQLNCKVEMLTINLMWFKRVNPLQNFGGSTILKIRTNTLAKHSLVNFVIPAWLYVIRSTEQLFCDDNAISSLPEIFITCYCNYKVWNNLGNLKNLPWSFEKTADRHVCIETFNKCSGFFWKYLLILNFFTRILNNQDDFLCIM